MRIQADILALRAEEKNVAEGLKALAALYGSGPRDAFFWKAATVFAYRLFVFDGIEEGMSVLTQVPPEYYLGAAVEQMKQDSLYAELARKLADKLVDIGRAEPPRFEVEPTKVNIQPVVGRA